MADQESPDTHPAWGMIGASRVQSGPPGKALFDSDIQHQHYVMVRLSRVERRRNLHRDHHFAPRRGEVVEITMSQAQWASFVSSMNVGGGVPCTIERIAGERMPEVEYEPRLVETMDEVRTAGDEAIAKIEKAFEVYREKKSAANLRSLEAAIKNLPSNLHFAAESLSEHAENVVQRARADIEAMVAAKAEQLSLEASDVGVALLPEGDEEGEKR